MKQRFHALDNMRAVMMLLGIVMHSAIAYATYTISVYSSFRDANHTYFLTGVAVLIHLFRMPAFFVVAGFFAAMLYYSQGAAAMLRNRIKRILVPLCVSWVILFPLTILAAAFTFLGGIKGVSTVIQQLRSGAVLKKNNMSFADLFTQLGLIHLWFLYYLMIYYLVATALLKLLKNRTAATRAVFGKAFTTLVRHSAGIIVFAAITFLTMYTMPAATTDRAGFETSNALLPSARVLAAYFVFFVFGWILFRQQYLFASLINKAWRNLFAGCCLAALYGYWVLNPPVPQSHIIQITIASFATWFLVFGITGIFCRYAGKPNAVARYLADASYWVYLVHLPLTLLLPGFLIGIDLPAIVKFLLVSGFTLLFSLVTYHYFVRSSFVGKALSGRRYLRSLPVPNEMATT